MVENAAGGLAYLSSSEVYNLHEERRGEESDNAKLSQCKPATSEPNTDVEGELVEEGGDNDVDDHEVCRFPDVSHGRQKLYVCRLTLPE